MHPKAQTARFENFAVIRRRGPGANAPRFAQRGIHAQSRIWADGLYLVNWMRGIDLDGRTTHPEHPDINLPCAVNQSDVARIFAEDCFWATYTHGADAQACHFEHIMTLICGAGIYDSSPGGNE
jgi:hypothetical protein